jgi:ferredoxin
MLWFLRGIRKGVVTTRYPRELDDWTHALPSPPAFRGDLLTTQLVDQLVAVCPSGALERDGDTLVLDLGVCSRCGRCLELAGRAATPSGEIELAARIREDLQKRIPIGVEA